MMIGRQILRLTSASLRSATVRNVHKGNESTPPMRFMSVPEKLGLYMFIAVSFLSYPTYLMARLDHLRVRPENSLGSNALEERERRLSSKKQ